MPTYQYVCTDCGDALEVQQGFSEESLTTCPACTGKLRKVFNAVGVVFKGSGFYRNDSRAPSAESKAADGSGSKEKASTGSSEAKGSGEKKSSGADSSGKSDGASAAPAKSSTGSAA